MIRPRSLPCQYALLRAAYTSVVSPRRLPRSVRCRRAKKAGTASLRQPVQTRVSKRFPGRRMASRGLEKQQQPLWSLPVSQRPPLSLASLLVTLPFALGFIVVFDVGILATVLLLVWLYPLYYWSIRTRRTYRQLGKRAFGRLLVLIVRWFSPTELVLSAGRGIDEQNWIERGTDGKLVTLNLPEKALWVRRPRLLLLFRLGSPAKAAFSPPPRALKRSRTTRP